jgi:hypothetical protein
VRASSPLKVDDLVAAAHSLIQRWLAGGRRLDEGDSEDLGPNGSEDEPITGMCQRL